MAEAIMNRKGFPNFTGYSAGSHPTGQSILTHLSRLPAAGMPVEGLRSKSWDEFGKPDAPKIHFVFTVCDREVAEAVPCLAGSTADGTVERPGPGSGYRYGRADSTRIFRSLENS